MKRFALVMFFCLVIASVSTQEQKGDLWILAVGIDAYPNNQSYLSLSFSVSDAKKIRDVFMGQEGKAFNNVHTLLIADTEAIKPTGSNILSNMSFFRKSQPNDTVILYFSLHSVLGKNSAFYLMPSDVRFDTNGKPVPATMVSFNDIVQSFNAPGKKIIVLDTHYSETAIRLAAGKNIAVFGACRDNEQAYESPFYGGGFFTLSIVGAFEEGIVTDGKVTLRWLLIPVIGRVKRISLNKQTPILYIPDEMGDVVLGSS